MSKTIMTIREVMADRSVLVRRAARRAWPWLPFYVRPETWWRGPVGEWVRVAADGSAEEYAEPFPHHRSVAANPSAGDEAK